MANLNRVENEYHRTPMLPSDFVSASAGHRPDEAAKITFEGGDFDTIPREIGGILLGGLTSFDRGTIPPTPPIN